MSPRESGPSPETQTEFPKPYDTGNAEAYIPFRSNRLEKEIMLVAGSLSDRINVQMRWLDTMNSAESREGLLTQIIEDALRREKNAGASFREMKALAKDYALLPDDKRAECEAIYERARVAMESARAAMDALIADPRLARHMEAEMIEEARRERPAYDTSRVA